MATGATGQLGLALPVQGELSGTWGDTVNNGITQYTNLAIAATLTLTGDGAVTLANTTGDASASNIVSSLTGAGTVTAQFAIVKVTGTLTVAKVVTAPSYSKTYTVVNAATGGIVTFKASGQTGVSIAVGESAFVYYNGTDYVKVSGTSSGAAAGSTTQVQYNNAGALAGSANLTFDGTTLTATGNAIVSDNSSNAALRITQLGTGNALLVEDSANPDASPFVVDASGNVIVGYTARVTSGNLIEAHASNTIAGSPGIGAYSWDTSTTGYPTFTLYKSQSDVVGTQGIVSSGALSAINFSFDDGAAFIRAASITATVDGTPGTSDMPGRLVFSTTADGASTPTERLRINSAGNILVGGTAARGTTVGAAHLDLFNGTAPAGTLTNGVSLYSSSGDLKFMNAAGDAFDVGYRNIPQNSQSANYTLVLGDSGDHIFHPVGDNNARTFTIPANSSVAFPIGTAVTFINMAVANVTIAITTDTLTLSPAGTTGSRTLARYGSATAIKITSTEWLISGSGLT